MVIAPTSLSSFSIGTMSSVRTPPSGPSIGRFSGDIGNLNHLLCIDDGQDRVTRASFRDWLGSQRVSIGGRQIVKRHSAEFLAIVQKQHAELSLADAHSIR